MSYYDEEFYQEPSEFEMQVNDFKQTILKSVKEEFIAEMEQLRNENAELQEVKNNFVQLKNEYRAKEHQLEIKMQDAKRIAYRARLSELMIDHKVLMYRANSKYKKGQKCDKCNETRKIIYTTPLGKEAHEDCDCAKTIPYYVPEEMVYAEFSIRNGKATVWYEIKENRDDDYLRRSSQHADQIYKKGTPYEDLKYSYRTFFESEEECKKYCDWLTEQK